jgi:serine/threonine protein phosphatase PrpC
MEMEILQFREDRDRIMENQINYNRYMKDIVKSFTHQMDSIDSLSLNDSVITEISSDQETQKALDRVIEIIIDRSRDILPPMKLQCKIPNASVKQPLVLSFTIVNPDISSKDELILEEVDGLNAIGGVKWNVDSQELIGTPEKYGDFTLTIKGVLKFAKGYSRRIESYPRFTVIPDPRSLWKDIEPDPTKPYPKSNEDYDYLETKNRTRLLYASKRGRSHAHIGSFRDDDGKIKTDNDSGWSVLAVGDGAGSCSLSRRGSEIVVDTTVNILLKYLSGKNGKMLEESFLENIENPSKQLIEKINEGINGTIVSSVHNGILKIHEEAKGIQSPIKDFSTTLLLLAHKQTPKGHLIISFWVGDGALVIYNRGEKVKLLGTPDSGEFAGQTRFLDSTVYNSSKEINRRFHILLVEDFTSLILATDGVTDPFFESDNALMDIEKWDDFWQEHIANKIEENNLGLASAQLLTWLDFWSKGNHDDRSIALLLPPIEPKKSIAIEGEDGSNQDD